MEIGGEVFAAWSGGGTKAEEQDVFQWFQAASEASTAGAVRPLPELAVMDKLNERRMAKLNSPPKWLSKRKRTVAQRPTRSKLKTPMPAASRSNAVSSLAGLFGQLMGGGGEPETASEPQPTKPETSTVAVDSSTAATAEPLLALQMEETGSDQDSAGVVDVVQAINETIAGHNLVVQEVRTQLASEWDFDPASAEKLVESLESMTANELEIARQVGSVPPSSHGQIDPIESVDNVLVEVNERLEALQAGQESFADQGFDSTKMQSLFDRLEQIRKDLQF